MSRIGRLPISLTPGVKVTVNENTVSVQGPKGALTQPLPPGITAAVDGETLVLHRRDDSKRLRALHGMARALLANAVAGVTRGFKKELEIQGVGYRAQLAGNTVTFNLGQTHPIEFQVPEGIQVAVDRQVRITVTGADRQVVGQVAAKMRALRPPDVYKGKGVRYSGEVIRKKAGKAGAK